MDAPDTRQSAGRSSAARTWRKLVVVALFLGAVGAFVWNQLPSGAYATDLSRIGQGRPAVVLAYDANFSGGMAVMELLNEVRAEHAERVEFLVAYMATADVREFAGRHGAGDGTVLLFAGDGRRVGVLHGPGSTAEIREAIVQAFGR